jgi:integrase
VGKNPKSLLFPSPHKKPDGLETTYSTGWFRRQVKIAMTSIGHDPDYYSGHSFRAGGATELFAIGLPYEQIKKFGRWKSDAALIYYRDQDHIEEAVAKAFSRAQKEWERHAQSQK